jgi:acetyl-CoA C-acetyltransferase
LLISKLLKILQGFFMSVYILSGSRTASGSFLGSLSTISAPKLGAVAIKGALASANIPPEKVNEVFMGHVVQAGTGQAPARQASLFAGIPNSVPATTVNKVCGSGMKTIIMGAQSILCGDNELVISGGMENMSMAPHVLLNSRKGIKFGSGELKDSMSHDGLWDVYSDRPMGNCAEECVTKFKFSREEQDSFSKDSYLRAQKAIKNGIFKKEISPVVIENKSGTILVDEDEGPFKVDFEKMKKIPPVFEKTGTITAANASSINDGAAALLLGGEKYKNQAKFEIISYAGHAQDPTWFTTAPAEAMKKALKKANLSMDKIGVFEINEAFSCVVLAAMKELNIDHNKVNIFGGAVSLGHPIGCSGARIVVTLMSAMDHLKSEYGMASICIGGGEALALIIKRV